jgi:hypothetical protein
MSMIWPRSDAGSVTITNGIFVALRKNSVFAHFGRLARSGGIYLLRRPENPSCGTRIWSDFFQYTSSFLIIIRSASSLQKRPAQNRKATRDQAIRESL